MGGGDICAAIQHSSQRVADKKAEKQRPSTRRLEAVLTNSIVSLRPDFASPPRPASVAATKSDQLRMLSSARPGADYADCKISSTKVPRRTKARGDVASYATRDVLASEIGRATICFLARQDVVKFTSLTKTSVLRTEEGRIKSRFIGSKNPTM
jgi:hypothetical protein